MNQRLILLITNLFFLIPLGAQQLVGMKKAQVEKEIKITNPSYVLDNSFVNKTYKYLKYIDKYNEQTLLVFLSDDDICTSTKLICDYSMLDQVKKDLKKYKSAGKDQWVYTKNGVQYLVKLKREEWFFSLFTSKKE